MDRFHRVKLCDPEIVTRPSVVISRPVLVWLVLASRYGCGTGKSKNSSETKPTQSHLVARLLAVVDLLQGDRFWSKEVAQFGQIHAVAQALLQFCGGRQLLVQTGLHPPAGRADSRQGFNNNTDERSSMSAALI